MSCASLYLPLGTTAHLSEPCFAASGVIEPERPASEVRTLQPVEARPALRDRVLVRLLGVDRYPHDLELVPGSRQVHIVALPVLDSEDLEGSAILQGARPLSQVAG